MENLIISIVVSFIFTILFIPFLIKWMDKWIEKPEVDEALEQQRKAYESLHSIKVEKPNEGAK